MSKNASQEQGAGMGENADDSELRRQLSRMEGLLQGVERFKDPEDAAKTREIVRTLMEFHGAAVGRMLEMLARDTAGGGEAGIHALARDELVAALLLLYGLHPLDLETRVLEALEKARPHLRSHGGNVELLGIKEGVVRLRLQGSCHGCPSSAVTLRQTIENAVMEKAPDVAGIEVEEEKAEPMAGPTQRPAMDNGGRVALPVLS
jgi:Fe-S cluster biogenesis protein NfuA